MARKPYTPERAYRLSVVPLGLLLAIGGLCAFGGAFVLPTTFVPFIQEIIHRRVAMAVASLVAAALGVGLLLRWKVAWYALFVYLALGTVWTVAGIVWDRHFEVVADIRWLLVCAELVMAAAIIAGIYVTTRAVFRPPRSPET